MVESTKKLSKPNATKDICERLYEEVINNPSPKPIYKESIEDKLKELIGETKGKIKETTNKFGDKIENVKDKIELKIETAKDKLVVFDLRDKKNKNDKNKKD